MTRGVQEVRRGSLTGEEIERIGNQIRHQLSGRLRDLRLVLGTAGIILRGRARTYSARQFAQDAVQAASDLPILRNEIEVL